MLLPVAAGALALLLLTSTAKASERKVQNRIASVVPSKKSKVARQSLAQFTQQKVPWKINPKTGKMMARVVIVETPAQIEQEVRRSLGRSQPVPMDVLALATMMSSEANSGPSLARVAIAHAAMTYARRKGKSITGLLMPDGRFGSQQGRYAATRHPPDRESIELAEAIVNGKIGNPTPGAVQWDSPRAQNTLLARGEPGYTRDAQQLGAKREGEGKQAVYLPGVDPGYLRMWRPIA